MVSDGLGQVIGVSMGRHFGHVSNCLNIFVSVKMCKVSNQPFLDMFGGSYVILTWGSPGHSYFLSTEPRMHVADAL